MQIQKSEWFVADGAIKEYGWSLLDCRCCVGHTVGPIIGQDKVQYLAPTVSKRPLAKTNQKL